jgi:glycosyltransferase involved in cell wall biosynthesis
MAGATTIWFAAAIPRNSLGGVSRVMAELSARLSDRGVNCVIVNAGRSTMLANYLVFSAWLAARYLFAFGKRPQWIVARSTDGLAVAIASRAFRLGVKTVLHSHGWEEKVYEVERRLPAGRVAPRTSWKARLIRFPLLRRMLALCDVCMCGTIEEARWVRKKYPGFGAKVVCVPNGAAASSSPHRDWAASTPADFLAVGNCTWKKNMGRTIAVFRAIREYLPGARLFVAGSTLQDIVGLTDASAIPGLSAVGAVPPQNMPAWYSRCPFFITTSAYEGGRSLALLEAMAHGCVVFASAIPSSLECIHDGVDGFIVSGLAPKEDALRIVQVLRNPALCASASAEAFLFAKRQSWERQARRFERVLCLKG